MFSNGGLRFLAELSTAFLRLRLGEFTNDHLDVELAVAIQLTSNERNVDSQTTG